MRIIYELISLKDSNGDETCHGHFLEFEPTKKI